VERDVDDHLLLVVGEMARSADVVAIRRVREARDAVVAVARPGRAFGLDRAGEIAGEAAGEGAPVDGDAERRGVRSEERLLARAALPAADVCRRPGRYRADAERRERRRAQAAVPGLDQVAERRVLRPADRERDRVHRELRRDPDRARSTRARAAEDL